MEVMTKKSILHDGHWVYADYFQRITAKEWKFLLLNYHDKVIFEGRVTKLIGKKLGYEVVEVSKTKE